MIPENDFIGMLVQDAVALYQDGGVKAVQKWLHEFPASIRVLIIGRLRERARLRLENEG